ncbi:MAG: bifunctional 5,10-methylenetetrahydrofolate dehydrogenase/5,10-methenyltetrahydrofolate cyclohydrolase [bacterium]|nr:bifunctional 5,10-methylenetetrahydrofolate dehydrogenase/5,10-methenyltetrahydrofolate cyclohydrolase [bacterium]
MIIDGRAIANDIKEQLKKEVKGRTVAPTLFIFSVGENTVSEKFLAIKKKFASDIGVLVVEKKFNNINTAELSKEISSIGKQANCGIIVQLPLPKDIEKQTVLNSIPPTHDVDVLSEESFKLYKDGHLEILPPVIGAIKEILFRHNIFVGNKNVMIVGKGKLVGEPAAIWFERHQGIVHVIDTKTKDPKTMLQNADIIVSGAGRPHFIKLDMIKEGVVILDAGTSEEGGKIAGDADPLCAKRALLFTPVPGGIGPVTVAMLFKNLLELTKN